jgi:hypothetical protein
MAPSTAFNRARYFRRVFAPANFLAFFKAFFAISDPPEPAFFKGTQAL